ncbi:hypothetical protein ACFX2I_022490 [Malus domestica]
MSPKPGVERGICCCSCCVWVRASGCGEKREEEGEEEDDEEGGGGSGLEKKKDKPHFSLFCVKREWQQEAEEGKNLGGVRGREFVVLVLEAQKEVRVIP